MEALDTEMCSNRTSDLGQWSGLGVSGLRVLSAFPVFFQGVTLQFLSSSAVNHELAQGQSEAPCEDEAPCYDEGKLDE